MNDDPEEYVDMCCVCGMPDGFSRLIRMTWIDESSETEFRMRIAVAKDFQSNDSLVCEQCIRDIKRLPFSTLDDNPPWTPKSCSRDGADCPPLPDEDIPF